MSDQDHGLTWCRRRDDHQECPKVRVCAHCISQLALRLFMLEDRVSQLDEQDVPKAVER